MAEWLPRRAAGLWVSFYDPGGCKQNQKKMENTYFINLHHNILVTLETDGQDDLDCFIASVQSGVSLQTWFKGIAPSTIYCMDGIRVLEDLPFCPWGEKCQLFRSSTHGWLHAWSKCWEIVKYLYYMVISLNYHHYMMVGICCISIISPLKTPLTVASVPVVDIHGKNHEDIIKK